MAQEDVLEILKRCYPRGKTLTQLQKILGITKRNVRNNCRRLKNAGDVELIIALDGRRNDWTTIYRWRKESNGRTTTTRTDASE